MLRQSDNFQALYMLDQKPVIIFSLKFIKFLLSINTYLVSQIYLSVDLVEDPLKKGDVKGIR